LEEGREETGRRREEDVEIRRERERGSKGEEEWRRDGMSSEIELCVGGPGRGGGGRGYGVSWGWES
jgi:hypothetical protein